MPNPFTVRPAAIGETCRQHTRFARRFGARMLAGGTAAIAHSVFPFPFVTTARGINDGLVRMRAASRGRTVKIIDAETLLPLDHPI